MLLRGVTLDLYTGNSQSAAYPQWQWFRSPSSTVRLEINGDHHTVQVPEHLDERGSIRQEIMLQPAGSDVLFALAGTTDIVPEALDGAILYSRRDESLRVEPTFDK